MDQAQRPLFQIDLQKIRTRKLMIATPMYGGLGHGLYFDSLLRLKTIIRQFDLPDFYFFSLFSESLIQRARNYCVASFLESDATHLLFLDADIGFNPEDVIAFLHLADPDSDKDVICAPYSKKHISWEKIVDAVNAGFAESRPDDLEKIAGDCVFNPIASGSYPLNELMEVAESGTGFMLIQRRVFNRFADAHPELSYLPDHIRTKGFDGSKEITTFFDCSIDPDTRRYLSEDYFFVKEVRKLGMKVWLAPWVRTTHIGNFWYKADMPAQSSLGLTPTVDASRIGKGHIERLRKKRTVRKDAK